MLVIGLTGSIAMGKSAAARLLRRRRILVHDADATVHALIGPQGRAVPAIAAAFPECVRGNAVDRAALGRLVFADPQALARLEAILHPMTRAAARRFLAIAARRRARLVVLDIPLLFEIGAERGVDAVLVMTAPAWLQRDRALRRPGMTDAKLTSILARQVPDRDKRRRADAVLSSAQGLARTHRDLGRLLAAWAEQRGTRWRPGWH
jgi:dephospho-CoA kinase